jgi:hypothetical protein
MGIYDGSKGSLLRGTGDGTYQSINALESGVFIEGEIRDLAVLQLGKERAMLFSRMNDSLIVLLNNSR